MLSFLGEHLHPVILSVCDQDTVFTVDPRAVGKIELSRPIDGRRRFSGVIRGEGEDGAHIELDDETELVAHVHEMSRASLILTDELIDAARAAGTLPPQPDEDDLGDLEIDETDEDTDTNEETGDVT